MTTDIKDIRKDYSKKELTEADVSKDAVDQFTKWWQEAVNSAIDEVNAMTLATASLDGLPSARIVLLKAFTKEGFVFFSNYESFKGRQLADNPKACLVFFWKELERQVRITGLVEKISELESDEYFFSRPTESRIGAAVSPQSQVIESREWLQQKFEKAKVEPVKRPSHWGGYRVRPILVEFWQGRPGRLHDRLQYSLNDDGSWNIERLAP
jgi:pyridoxamine 5'-phosphate oxidase